MLQQVVRLASSEKLTIALSVILALLLIVSLFTLPTHQKVSIYH